MLLLITQIFPPYTIIFPVRLFRMLEYGRLMDPNKSEMDPNESEMDLNKCFIKFIYLHILI